LESLKGRDESENLEVDGEIILEWFLRKEGGYEWIGCIWFRMGIIGKLS
jgi:hypothetical protein